MRNKLYTINGLLLLIALFTLVGNVVANEYSKSFVGTWEQQLKIKPNILINSIYVFSPEGKFEERSIRTQGDNIYSYKTVGNWFIKGKYIYFEVTHSTNIRIKPGSKDINKILEINDTYSKVIGRTGRITTAYRKNTVQ